VAALKTLITAVQQGDFATMRQAMVIPPERKADIDTFIDAMAASARLQKAAQDNFGPVGAAQFGLPSAAQFARQIKRVDDSLPKIDGDAATLEVSADPTSGQQDQTVQLKKVGDAWKVDAAAYFHLTGGSPETIAERVALTRQITTIADVVAKNITAGKYYSAAIAYQDYWNRSMQATKAPADNAATTSAPASTVKTTAK
jgi:copper chaperone CopZ